MSSPLLAPNADARILAESMKQMYDEYIKVGFTEKQALYLVGQIIRRPEENK